MNRRNFLHAGAAGTAALSAASAYAAGENKRVGLIGSGWYGKSDLLRLIQDGGRGGGVGVDAAEVEEEAADVS
jgi:ATPase subunit of ABC transporter with duplicated ATPase domains